jgi:AAA15 family ATPase/GTPase
MKAIKVQIKNYRSIHDAIYNLTDYSLLIGSNNAGKSTLVNAIRAFYEKDGFKYNKEKDYPFDLEDEKQKESWIEIEFSLTDDEYLNLADQYKTELNKLKVRKYFETSSFTNNEKKNGAGQIFGYGADDKLIDTPFYGAKNVQNGKFGELIFIPAISKVDDHTKLSGPSILRDLISGILADAIDFEISYKKLGENFSTFSETMRNSITQDGRSINAVETSLNGMLDDWGISFNLNWSTPSMSEIIKSMISPTYMDNAHNKNIAIGDCGSGFQRHLIFSIIKTGADFSAKRVATKKVSFEPDLKWIIFEEPEAFLHPPQQNELARNLSALSKLCNTQVLATTHSANFISRDLQSIIGIARIAKDKAGISQLWQISTKDWEEIIDNNLLIAKLPSFNTALDLENAKPEMEAIKYALYLNSERASMFFAKRVLIVEGPTELALINKLIDDGRINNIISGSVVIDSIGKYNIHRFMNLLGHLGISHSVLHDEDSKTNTRQQELNNLIVSSKNNLTFAIDMVSPDLEGYLELPAVEKEKPQNVIYNFMIGKYNTKQMDLFCNKVEKLLAI